MIVYNIVVGFPQQNLKSGVIFQHKMSITDYSIRIIRNFKISEYHERACRDMHTERVGKIIEFGCSVRGDFENPGALVMIAGDESFMHNHGWEPGKMVGRKMRLNLTKQLSREEILPFTQSFSIAREYKKPSWTRQDYETFRIHSWSGHFQRHWEQSYFSQGLQPILGVDKLPHIEVRTGITYRQFRELRSLPSLQYLKLQLQDV